MFKENKKMDSQNITALIESIKSKNYKNHLEYLNKQCKSKFVGSKEERSMLEDIKIDILFWNSQLEDLKQDMVWLFPNILCQLNISEYLVKKSYAYLMGHNFCNDIWTNCQIENMKLYNGEKYAQKPSKEILNRSMEVIKDLHCIWAVASIKFTEAVSKKDISLQEKLLQFEGIVDFNLSVVNWMKNT